MKNKKTCFYSVLILATVIYSPLRAQHNPEVSAIANTLALAMSSGPKSIVRTIKQDKKGNLWVASWEGIFKYDGKSFINITHNISTARFFSVLEDRDGNFWFASVGSGVYFYNGKSFQHFTTKNGLANDRVTHIYEDKTGHIWFGTEGGASRYDGKSFKNFKVTEAPEVTQSDSTHISAYQSSLPDVHWMHNDVNSIIEDRTGKLWFATRGHTFVYDGQRFTSIKKKDGKPFVNTRSLIVDKKGNVWLGGNDGLWRYDGHTFTNFTKHFVGNVYEDRKGDIWMSSVSASGKGWALSRYLAKSLSNDQPVLREIINQSMIFGILEDDKRNIWFGSLNGVYRYDGKTTKKF